jgi:hypothetical protein
MRITLVIGALALGLVVPRAGRPDELRYLGKHPGSSLGVIELGEGHHYEVGAGTEVPAWGRIKELADDHLVVEQTRAEHEKQALRQQGLLDYDVLEIRVPREDLRHPREGNPLHPGR